MAVGVFLFLNGAEGKAQDDFRFFTDPEIDYWKKSGSTLPPQPAQSTIPSEDKEKPSVTPTTKGFAWEKYLNPAHDDFFREGEYTPPAPFVEIARNPTDENIERWFRYIEMKNNVLQRLQQRLGEYAQRNPGRVSALPAPFSAGLEDDPEAMQKVAARATKPAPIAPDAKRFRLRMYFDSRCPHCERMMGTLAALSRQGYFVELRQVDQDRSVRSRIPFPVADAAPEELKTYGIESVPVLLVGDLKNKTFFKMQGYQSTGGVMAALR